jgi:Flp pilus assembly protein TadG
MTMRRLLRLRRSWRDERGAVMVIAIGIMVAMLGMAALAIDLGSLWQTRGQAQSAADAAVLAAVQDLPASPTTAGTDAQSYVTKNIPGATATVTTPYGGSASEIKVTVTKTAPTFFAKALGISSETISATAVAKVTPGVTSCATPGTGCYAMFAMDQSCAGNPIFLGGGTHIIGGLTSNGSLNVGGGGSTFGNTTYGNGSGCTVRPAGWASQNNTFTSGPTAKAPTLSWPVNFATDFPACVGAACTGPSGTPSFCTQATTATSEYLHTYNPSNLVSNQIYCDVGTGTAATPTTWNGAIEVAGGPIESSFVGGTVKIDGGTTLTACGYSTSGYAVAGCSAAVPVPATTNYPLVYAVGTGTSIDDSAGGTTFHGDMFAPNGTANIGGGTWTTFVEAFDVSAAGGGFTGDGPSDTGTTTGPSGTNALIQ